MPIQTYNCRTHGLFDVKQSIEAPVYPIYSCPQDRCSREGDWVPTVLGGIIVEGGTGAGRQSHYKRTAGREKDRERRGY